MQTISADLRQTQVLLIPSKCVPRNRYQIPVAAVLLSIAYPHFLSPSSKQSNCNRLGSLSSLKVTSQPGDHGMERGLARSDGCLIDRLPSKIFSLVAFLLSSKFAYDLNLARVVCGWIDETDLCPMIGFVFGRRLLTHKESCYRDIHPVSAWSRWKGIKFSGWGGSEVTPSGQWVERHFLSHGEKQRVRLPIPITFFHDF
ncbi:hypothetical protein V8F20_000172 [Naviculisporaceae sp. PSN 640]